MMTIKERKTNYELFMESPELLAKGLASAYIIGMETAKVLSYKEIEDYVNNNDMINALISVYYRKLMDVCVDYYGVVD